MTRLLPRLASETAVYGLGAAAAQAVAILLVPIYARKLGPEGVGVTGVSDAPFAATDAEAILNGKTPSEDLFRQAGGAAGAQSRPVADVRGPVDYKRAMVREMTLRALRAAHECAVANA